MGSNSASSGHADPDSSARTGSELSPGDRIELRTDAVVAGGDAIARADDGRVVFIAGALGAEHVVATVETVRRDVAFAVLSEVIEPSAHRRVAPCGHRHEGCGGCGWMELEDTAQSAAKVGIVSESLRRIARLDEDRVGELVRFGGSVEPFDYRTTARVRGTGDGVGFVAVDGSTLPIVSCDIVDPALRKLMAGTSAPAGCEVTLRTSLSTGVATAYVHPPGNRADVELPEGVHAGRRAFLMERVADVDLRVSSSSFFQSGPQAAELLVDAVGDALPDFADAEGYAAADLYAGVGLFGATVLAGASSLVSVESSRIASLDAAANLGERSVVARTEVAKWRPKQPLDVVVADPARPGLGAPGVAAIVRADAPVSVVVHCDPASLARDAALLADVGYVPESVTVLDLFPQTHHVETVTRFVKGRESHDFRSTDAGAR